MKQLVLPLELPKEFDAGDFIISESNEEAYLWLKKWPHWPHPMFAIYGDKGCGKTHLSHVWACKDEARSYNADEFNKTDLSQLLEGKPTVLIEDAHLAQMDEKFFHFYNHIFGSGGNLLLLSETPPAYWTTSIDDLRSRLNSIPAIKIHAPDERLLTQVIKKQFDDLQLKVDAAVISYLFKHMERSFESARMWVSTLNERALTHQRSITIALVRECLQIQESDETYQ